jgi:hypothetical protein
MKIRTTRLAAAFVSLCLSLNTVAFAADADTATSKAEAAKRFERALSLFNEGDNAGALAEFKQTYQIMPNPVVLYNIGLVYAAMGRPVDAVDALTQVLATGGLNTDQLERAKQTLADQQARIGHLSVTSTPEGAHVEIDNVEVASTPLAQPLRVAEGSHVVGVVAEGYAAQRKEVVIAGNAEATLHFDLVRSIAKRPANLTVRSRLIGADVLVDGKPAGTTPLTSSLNVAAGKHTVELKRAGYTSEKQEIDLGEGATGEISLNPRIDQQALSGESALLTLDLHRRTADVFIDDDHVGLYAAAIRLPKGPHRMRLEAAGFLPLEQTVTVGTVEGQVVDVWFQPTPETRAAHDSNVRLHRTFGWIGVGAGALLTGGAVTWLIVKHGPDQKAVDAARTDFNIANDAAAKTLGPNCNYLGKDPNFDPSTMLNTPEQCTAYTTAKTDALNSALDKQKSHNTVGFIGVGVGAALAVTGVVLLVTGESAHEYDHTADAKRSRWALAPGPGQFGMGLSAAF